MKRFLTQNKIVLIAAYDHPSNQGGVSTFNRNLIKIFKEEDMYILAYKTQKEMIYKEKIKNLIEFYPKNKKLRRMDRKFLNYKFQKFLLKVQMNKLGAKICICNSPLDIEIVKNYNCKKILIQHMCYENFLKIYNLNKERLKEILNYVDKFICLSNFDKIKFIKELGIEEQKIEVIHHTTNLERLNKRKIVNKTLIMIARQKNQSKRFDLAINTMKKLSDHELKIYGTGDKSDIKKL